MNSPVDRIPRVGEVWRLAATVNRGPIEARIIEVDVGNVHWTGEEWTSHTPWPVFRASARFLRERG
jgi:hypothetical protein